MMVGTCGLYGKMVRHPRVQQTFCRFGKCIDCESKIKTSFGVMVKTVHCENLKGDF